MTRRERRVVFAIPGGIVVLVCATGGPYRYIQYNSVEEQQRCFYFEIEEVFNV